MCVRAEHFAKVNGYNERMIGYGWEDDDLYGRLRKFGLKEERVLHGQGLYHVPHYNPMRYENYSVRGYGTSKTNRESADKEPWTPQDKRMQFREEKASDRFSRFWEISALQA